MPLLNKIEAGEFIVLGEFEPPKGADFSSLLESANHVKGRVDALVVPEMGSAVMKAIGCRIDLAQVRNHILGAVWNWDCAKHFSAGFFDEQ